MRSISIFGATGSIGAQTIELIQRQGGADAFRIVALSGGRNIARLAAQARALRAELAVTSEPALLPALREALAGTATEVAAGAEAIREAAARPADWVMSAIVGAAGLVPGLTALRHGQTLALANKESLVTAGPLLLAEARKYGARILPVDSEHSAVFQALGQEDMAAVEKVTITASGGAFRDWPLAQLAGASVTEASSHPNFNMGQRITIDSATMFNKALEVIEAKEFFGLTPEQIAVIVQREQIIHALVDFRDGAVMAHLGAPDMRHAIGFALNWPERADLPVARLDLVKLGQLSFAAPDPARYPALPLAYEVMRLGGLAGAAFNAAKERALDRFLDGSIGFMDMARVVETVLNTLVAQGDLGSGGTGAGHNRVQDLEAVLAMDHLARIKADEAVGRLPTQTGRAAG